MQNLLPFTIILATTFTLIFGSVWLIPIAVAVDAYYGAFSSLPIFSLISIFWYVLFELIRPHLRILK